MKTLEGKLLWFEKGSSRVTSDDCYFFTASIETNSEDYDILGKRLSSTKGILKANEAKRLFAKAKEVGIIEVRPNVYETKKQQYFKMTVSGEPIITGKNKIERKYQNVVNWELQEEPWNKETGKETSRTLS